MSLIPRISRPVLGAVLTITLAFAGPQVFAQVMQSGSYQIDSDSVNAGGLRSSSGSFTMEDTAGEIATGESGSGSYTIRAGYQQMHAVYLALSAASDVVMSNSIGGITGGFATGSTAVTATTDSRAGYQLTIEASTSPAMRSGSNTIADYAPAGDPDFSFTTDATDAHFGYSPEGAHIADRFRDTAGVCNSGSGDSPDACWDGLATSPVVIAETNAANHPAGTETVVKFQVGVGGSAVQAPGTYYATTTLTLLPL